MSKINCSTLWYLTCPHSSQQTSYYKYNCSAYSAFYNQATIPHQVYISHYHKQSIYQSIVSLTVISNRKITLHDIVPYTILYTTWSHDVSCHTSWPTSQYSYYEMWRRDTCQGSTKEKSYLHFIDLLFWDTNCFYLAL